MFSVSWRNQNIMNKLSVISETNPKSSSKQKNTIEALKKNSGNTQIETKFDKIFLSKKSEAKTSINRNNIVSDVRYNLVKKFREVIADGSYQIKSEELADKIVQKVTENKNKIF
jgi:anti-sigma28 factor (negative regulator of flagellin synthesis)